MIVDTFQFFNELDILELRLRTLDEKVDLFILAESRETHVGHPKPLYYEENKERFAPWAHKIRHVICPPCEKTGLWDREKHQRECVLLGLGGVPDDAIILISDVDEIPNLDKVTDTTKTLTFHMYMFEYSFDYMFTGEPWFGTVMTHAKEFRKLGPNFFRDCRWRFPYIPYAGWHCSSFGDARHVQHKIQNYAHAADDKHKGHTFQHFETCVREGIHADGSTKLIPTPDDVSLPKGWDTVFSKHVVGDSS